MKEYAEPCNCLVCKAPLKYHVSTQPMTCLICGRQFESTVQCINGHYICDECHAYPSYAVIKYQCLKSRSRNPIELINQIMNLPEIHMHGPEHHVLVGSVLLTAYKNSGGDIDLACGLNAVQIRGSKIPGGSCGLAGCCGSAVSAGIFLSVVLRTNPLSETEWRLGMQLTSSCLSEIAEQGGPRCCKRDSYISIITAVTFIKKHLDIVMDLPEKISCTYSPLNRECRHEHCLFFR